MQSRRAYIAEVSEISDCGTVASRPGAALADPDGVAPTPGQTCVLVGPEGGWTESERRVQLSHVNLGSNVLRAETAAIVAGALLVALRSGLVQHARSLPATG